MKKLLDNIIMSDAYCEITDCRGIENCEKCVELNIAKHDKKIREDAIKDFAKYLSDNSELGAIVWLYKASYVSEQLQKGQEE